MLAAIGPRDSAVDACAKAVRGAVLSGELAVGGRLPPERTLAATFHVNRVTVRHALARLVDEGLLSVRQGSGYVVQDYLKGGGPELVVALAQAATSRELKPIVRDLLEVRRGVARAVLERLAARRPSREALRRVQAAVEELERAIDAKAPVRALARADLDVLAAVVACTGSAVMQLALNPIAATVLGVPALLEAMFAEPRQNVAGWRLFLEWLENPSAQSVDLVMAVLQQRDQATVAGLRKETP